MDVYLDNAATSHPKPEGVVKAVGAAMTRSNANPGRSGHRRALEAARVVLNCRESLAALFGAEDPMQIAFCFNCTDALNLAIKGSLRRGDHVVSSFLEHNSILRVLMELKARRLIELTLARPDERGEITPETVGRALRPNTRLVALSQASNVTGRLQPCAAIGALCRERGVRYLVDGAQSAGAMEIDVRDLRCDLFAFPGHKGLLGPQGTGGLYIAPGVRLNTVREGGTGSSSESMRQPDEQPERYESGTVNMHGLAGLRAGADYVRKHARGIRERERTLTAQLLEELDKIEGVTLYGAPEAEDRVGVVSFNVGDLASGAVADLLSGRGIAVRGGLHCAPGTHMLLGTTKRGAVRASVGWANTAADVDELIQAVREIARKGGQTLPNCNSGVCAGVGWANAVSDVDEIARKGGQTLPNFNSGVYAGVGWANAVSDVDEIARKGGQTLPNCNSGVCADVGWANAVSDVDEIARKGGQTLPTAANSGIRVASPPPCRGCS